MGRQRESTHNYTGNYLISISDMFMGLLFLFIILLVYYASQTNITRKKLSDARETRSNLLLELKENLNEGNIQVIIDESNGILRLPDGTVSFIHDSDEFESESSLESLRKLSDAFVEILPCYIGATDQKNCKDILHYVESVFVEGHTDSTGSNERNWRLSSERGYAAYKVMLEEHPELNNFLNRGGKNLFSISGYGEGRPLLNKNNLDKDLYNRLNRRIDFRFIMTPPENLEIEDGKLKFTQVKR